MNEKRLLQALCEYQRLEDRFVELTQYIPLAANLDASNYKFPSPQAASFGLDCCTWLETLMTELINDSRLDSLENIDRLRKDSYRYIENYRIAFKTKFGFGTGGWKLKNLGGDEINPFESWNADAPLEWFHIYSKFKHDRFALAEKWTMKHALEAFVALTIVLQHWKKPAEWEGRKSKVLDGVIV